MARRIQPIIDSILADARIVGRERTFVESIADFYKRNKRLSAGRRRCLLDIEERLKAAPISIDPTMKSRLDGLLSRATKAGDKWAMDFIPSLEGQLLAGRDLSPRQKEILAKVETRHSDEAQAARDNWASTFTSEMREKMCIAARYYLANPPYFRELAKKALEDDAFVPSERAYKKMVENKFAKKVIAATLADPRYSVGSLVALRATAPSHLLYITRSILGENKTRTGKLATVIKTDAKPVTSPARGSKVYSVLFFGETQPAFIEERWLKKGKA